MSRSSARFTVRSGSHNFPWRRFACGFAAVGVVVYAALGSALPTSINRPVRSKLRQPAALDSRLLAVMSRLGMDPAALAVAGLSANQAGTVASQLKEFLTDHGADWDALLAAESAAQADLDRATRYKASGRGTPPGLDIGQLQSRIAESQQSRVTLLASARAATMLATDQAAVLDAVRANQRWPVPIEYKGVQRSEQGWVSLMARLATRNSSDVSPDDTETVTLRERLANKPAIETAVMTVAGR